MDSDKEDPASPQRQAREMVFVALLVLQSVGVAWAYGSFPVDRITKAVLWLLELLLLLLIILKIVQAARSLAVEIFDALYYIRGRISGQIHRGRMSLEVPGTDHKEVIEYEVDFQAMEHVRAMVQMFNESRRSREANDE